MTSWVFAQASGSDPLGGLGQLANWLAQYGLWFALGAIVAGAGMLGVSQLFGSSSDTARSLIIAGAFGAGALGVSAFVVTFFSNGFGTP